MSHQLHQTCIAACYACADACDHCTTACLDEKELAMMVGCIKLDQDCAAICRLAASFMARGSPHAAKLCALCAEICEACAGQCAQHAHAHCQACAEACRSCAAECRKMAA